MTTESWGVALVVLAAVLVGAAIPALVQLRATLRAVERTLQRSGARLDEALAATLAAAGRIDAVVVRLEKGGRVEELVDGLAAASRLVVQLRDTVRVASAVGAAVAPAVAAAVRALRQEPEAAATPLRSAGADSAVPHEPRRQASP
ncbi:MAG: hypothetical protein HZB56_08275 [Deltaproteobacteria bacterium]|nr:hypothetical protein [Deltaproteobacteria bacterium]